MYSPTISSQKLPAEARSRGFTLIELLVSVSILGILMAVGLPGIFSWLNNARANSLPDYYMDGLRRAREGAIKYNSASRLVLTPNANGQFDWQIDWCSPIAGVTCGPASGTWSTTASPVSNAAGQPRGPSVFRSATGLPPSGLISTTTNSNKTEVYFNSLGWLTNGGGSIRRILFTPADTDIRPVQISITLAGVAERCDPSAAANDSRGCP